MTPETRGAFIATATGLALATGVDGTAATQGPYDFAAVAARLARPAQHRQVFAAASVADGLVFSLVRHGLDAYEIARREGRGALHAAVVLYGRGVVLGLDDDAWRTYALAENVRRRGDVLTARERATNPFAPEIAELGGRGCTYLVCDNALADWAAFLVASGSASASVDDVRSDLRRRTIRSALLVPAGVAALNEAQEARFTFVQASL